MAALDFLSNPPIEREHDPDEIDVAGFDLFPRAAFKASKQIERAIESIISKGKAAREGVTEKYPYKDMEFLALGNQQTGETHYRKGKSGYVPVPPRDRDRLHLWSQFPELEAFTVHNHPGGGPPSGSPGDLGLYSGTPNLDHFIAETPPNRATRYPVSEQLSGVWDERTGYPTYMSPEEADAYFKYLGQADIPEDWVGSLERLKFEVDPDLVKDPLYSLRSEDPKIKSFVKAATDNTSGMNHPAHLYSDLARDLILFDEFYDVSPKSMRMELRRGVFSRLAEELGDELKYEYYATDPERFLKIRERAENSPLSELMRLRKPE